jgi:hypothetical protein
LTRRRRPSTFGERMLWSVLKGLEIASIYVALKREEEKKERKDVIELVEGEDYEVTKEEVKKDAGDTKNEGE